MIGANLESLGLPHNQPNLSGLLVLQQPHAPRTSLLPLVPLFIEPIQLRFPRQNQDGLE